MRCARGLRELGTELAEGEVLAALVDEGVGRGVPERGRPTVAEHDLVAVRDAEQLAQTRAHATDQILDRGLSVRGAEQVGVRHEEVELLLPDLRRSAAEPTVGGQQRRGNHEAGHGDNPIVWPG